mmetsp:Transcript_54915/g.157928  ORF Transcript_54915/g.157928 Transcript_54915/m.157928 type:complete len:384 (-) Transcript_54915:343-1494(-)
MREVAREVALEAKRPSLDTRSPSHAAAVAPRGEGRRAHRWRHRRRPCRGRRTLRPKSRRLRRPMGRPRTQSPSGWPPTLVLLAKARLSFWQDGFRKVLHPSVPDVKPAVHHARILARPRLQVLGGLGAAVDDDELLWLVRLRAEARVEEWVEGVPLRTCGCDHGDQQCPGAVTPARWRRRRGHRKATTSTTSAHADASAGDVAATAAATAAAAAGEAAAATRGRGHNDSNRWRADGLCLPPVPPRIEDAGAESKKCNIVGEPGRGGGGQPRAQRQLPPGGAAAALRGGPEAAQAAECRGAPAAEVFVLARRATARLACFRGSTLLLDSFAAAAVADGPPLHEGPPRQPASGASVGAATPTRASRCASDVRAEKRLLGQGLARC